MSGFTKKRLELTITLGTGAFGETVGDTVKLSGLRMSADIAMAGGETMGALQLRVFGLTQAMMNRLTTIGYVATALLGKNTVSLAAGDDNGMAVIYEGAIMTAWADYASAPDVAFNVLAQAGAVDALKPVASISFKGSVDVAVIMSGLAKTMGLTFENQGVSVSLSNPTYAGTAWAQMRACARQADIWATVDRGALIITPKQHATKGSIPVISAETGMVGYPSFSSRGLSVQTLFNPLIRMPGLVEVRSSIPLGGIIFRVSEVSHSLSSETPGGPWFTTVTGYPDVG